MYKNLKIKLGEMSLSKDFVNDTRGDLYPVMHKSPDCVECVENNCYVIKCGAVKSWYKPIKGGLTMTINYIRTGDYFIPDLKLQEETRPIGK